MQYTRDLDELARQLRGEYGWELPAPITSKNRELCLKELAVLRAKHSDGKRALEGERDELRAALQSNPWLSERDRTETLYRHEAKIKLLHEIEKGLEAVAQGLSEPVVDPGGKLAEAGRAAQTLAGQTAPRHLVGTL